jgi:predicted AAA+ superfamily ATPase
MVYTKSDTLEAMQYQRATSLPSESFFLFGPRGTGKSTWLKSVLPKAQVFNLLLTREYLRFSQDPDSFRNEILSLPKGSWVVVDEVQRLPSLLNEVHALMEDHPAKYRFALTGSSARKLKRDGANLLAGRALVRKFFPLTHREIGSSYRLDRALKYGTLPRAWSNPAAPEHLPTDTQACEFLESYIETYLREEIQQEALVRKLDSFARFLEVAALCHGQVLNVAAVSRDAQVSRQTVQGFYQVLEDTLIGFRLPAWRPRLKVKEVEHPKFYFFDTGVLRALKRRLDDEPDQAETGLLFETLLLHELRAHDSIAGLRGEFYYWRTPSGSEIDLIWTKGRRAMGFEFKSGRKFRRESATPLLEAVKGGKLKRGFIVHQSSETLRISEHVQALPVERFLKELEAGRILE